jgi:D-methionine transport system ATP-binding protein
MEKCEIVEQGDVFTIFSSPQKPITKDFVNTTSNLSRINTLLNEKSPVVALKAGEILVKLLYTRRDVSEAIISDASRAFDVSFNIIFADVEIIRDAPLGGTVSIVSGKRENIEAALAHIREKNVFVEVLKRA